MNGMTRYGLFTILLLLFWVVPVWGQDAEEGNSSVAEIESKCHEVDDGTVAAAEVPAEVPAAGSQSGGDPAEGLTR